MRTDTHENAVVSRVSRYFDRLFERLEDRVEARVLERVEATIDLLTDRALMDDLAAADAQPDSEARSFAAIKDAHSGRA